MHPNSLKNLKPYVAGQPSSNPSGGPRALLTRAQVEHTFQSLSRKNAEEIRSIATDNNRPYLDVIIANIMVKAAEDGDAFRLAFLLDRAVGKVATVTETIEEREARERREALQAMTDDQIIEMCQEKIAEIKGAKAE